MVDCGGYHATGTYGGTFASVCVYDTAGTLIGGQAETDVNEFCDASTYLMSYGALPSGCSWTELYSTLHLPSSACPITSSAAPSMIDAADGCSSSSDCAPGQACAYAVSEACAAQGRCISFVPGEAGACQSATVVCGCNGQHVAVPNCPNGGGYALAPVAPVWSLAADGGCVIDDDAGSDVDAQPAPDAGPDAQGDASDAGASTDH
jgi:hypothetical protein